MLVSFCRILLQDDLRSQNLYLIGLFYTTFSERRLDVTAFSPLSLAFSLNVVVNGLGARFESSVSLQYFVHSYKTGVSVEPTYFFSSDIVI